MDRKCTHVYLIRIQLAKGKCRWDYGVPVKCSWRDLYCNHCRWPRSHGSSRFWGDGNQDTLSSEKEPKLEILYPGTVYNCIDATCHIHVYKFCLAEKSYSEAGPHIPCHRHQDPSGLHQNCRHRNVISGKQPALLKLDKLCNINIYATILKRLQYHNWHYIWHLWLTRVTFTLMAILSSL